MYDRFHVEGTVLDENGHLLAGAKVAVSGASQPALQTKTYSTGDARGYYNLGNLVANGKPYMLTVYDKDGNALYALQQDAPMAATELTIDFGSK